MSRSKKNHTEKLNAIMQHIDGFWKSISELKDTSDLEVNIFYICGEFCDAAPVQDVNTIIPKGVSRTQKSMEESLKLKIEHNPEFVQHVDIPGLEAEDPLPDHTSTLISNTNTISREDLQMDSEPQIESEFEAQLMASSNHHVESESKEAEFSWQADQSKAIYIGRDLYQISEVFPFRPIKCRG
jgi:hypothetical protein